MAIGFAKLPFMQLNDTIVAVSSASGHGARGIVRLSGPEAREMALNLVVACPNPIPSRQWISGQLRFGHLPVGLLLFQGPASFTGQDMAELHLPGIPALIQHVIANLQRAGARMASPGEFSYRACELGKMDISRAEGINAVIYAQSEQEFSAASALRCGALYQWAQTQSTQLAELLALVEAGIDFTDEHDVGAITVPEFSHRIKSLRQQLEELNLHSQRWQMAEHRPTAVLVGRPNAGKSSLFNALLGRPRAMVSPVAGTTRDSIAALLATPYGVVTLMDSAGYEANESPLQGSMNHMRESTVQRADVVIWVSENEDDTPLNSTGPIHIRVKSKADTGSDSDASHRLAVSSLAGTGIAELTDRIGRQAFGKSASSASRILLNARHLAELELADAALARVSEEPQKVESEPELIAADLRAALNAIGRITGVISSDDILGLIFSRFCVGK